MVTEMKGPETLSILEVGVRLNVSRPTAYRLAHEGRLPGCIRVGRQWRVVRRSFEAWLNGEKPSA